VAAGTRHPLPVACWSRLLFLVAREGVLTAVTSVPSAPPANVAGMSTAPGDGLSNSHPDVRFGGSVLEPESSGAWWCSRCALRWEVDDVSLDDVRADLAAEWECEPGDISDEDVSMHAAGCPGCGWLCYSEPVP
jgi:hypothetical protein